MHVLLLNLQMVLTDAVVAGLRSIGVHNLSPGMVLTDLLLMDASPVGRRFINVLADEPETVAAAVVPQIRATQACPR